MKHPMVIFVVSRSFRMSEKPLHYSYSTVTPWTNQDARKIQSTNHIALLRYRYGTVGFPLIHENESMTGYEVTSWGKRTFFNFFISFSFGHFVGHLVKEEDVVQHVIERPIVTIAHSMTTFTTSNLTKHLVVMIAMFKQIVTRMHERFLYISSAITGRYSNENTRENI